MHLRSCAAAPAQPAPPSSATTPPPQMSKAPIQAFADRVSAVFVPVIVALALATWALWCGARLLQRGQPPLGCLPPAARLPALPAHWPTGARQPAPLAPCCPLCRPRYAAGVGGWYPPEWRPHDQSPFLFAFLFGIASLVIACPCALGLATPTAVCRLRCKGGLARAGHPGTAPAANALPALLSCCGRPRLPPTRPNLGRSWWAAAWPPATVS